MLRSLLLVSLLSLGISTASDVREDFDQGDFKSKIHDYYNSLLVDTVTSELLANYQQYIQSPNTYWEFLEKTFLINWDFDATTKALIGNEIFNSLSDVQHKRLTRSVELTLIRYAFESLWLYREQKLYIIDLKVNEQQTFAWLKINMDSPRFPDIHLDLLLKRTSDYTWQGIDFRFKGITYVNLKKNSYRQDFEDLKFQGLLRKLDDKNKVFFRDLCQSDTNYLDPKKPPCLQNYD